MERKKLKDILPDHYINIQSRTYDPDGEDVLFGYCYWTGTELVSGDGDSYSLEEEVLKYEFNEYGLAYWFESEWISGKDISRGNKYETNKSNLSQVWQSDDL